ncbi:MAG TPA: multiubiquitin domain-containing protein [Chloroflexota bacterium]|jgi:hypothetical protein
MNQDEAVATERESGTGEQHGSVTVSVNGKAVRLPSHRVNGLEVKRAAIGQGVEIQEDFLLTLEAHDGKPAETIANDRTITVTEHSVFTANDGDDDS